MYLLTVSRFRPSFLAMATLGMPDSRGSIISAIWAGVGLVPRAMSRTVAARPFGTLNGEAVKGFTKRKVSPASDWTRHLAW
jgi:hypothetical protein